MTRNWYIFYVKPGKELRVATLLTRNNILNFCPVNRVSKANPVNTSFKSEPLISSHIFVHVSEEEIGLVMKLNDVISVFHWKHMPAIVNNDEIKILRDFSARYCNIEVEQIPIGDYGRAGMPHHNNDKNYLYSISHDSVKVHLPSLGYLMVAPKTAPPIAREKFMLPKRLVKQFQMNFFNF